eukprot:g3891.t1
MLPWSRSVRDAQRRTELDEELKFDLPRTLTRTEKVELRRQMRAALDTVEAAKEVLARPAGVTSAVGRGEGTSRAHALLTGDSPSGSKLLLTGDSLALPTSDVSTSRSIVPSEGSCRRPTLSTATTFARSSTSGASTSLVPLPSDGEYDHEAMKQQREEIDAYLAKKRAEAQAARELLQDFKAQADLALSQETLRAKLALLYELLGRRQRPKMDGARSVLLNDSRLRDAIRNVMRAKRELPSVALAQGLMVVFGLQGAAKDGRIIVSALMAELLTRSDWGANRTAVNKSFPEKLLTAAVLKYPHADPYEVKQPLLQAACDAVVGKLDALVELAPELATICGKQSPIKHHQKELRLMAGTEKKFDDDADFDHVLETDESLHDDEMPSPERIRAAAQDRLLTFWTTIANVRTSVGVPLELAVGGEDEKRKKSEVSAEEVPPSTPEPSELLPQTTAEETDDEVRRNGLPHFPHAGERRPQLPALLRHHGSQGVPVTVNMHDYCRCLTALDGPLPHLTLDALSSLFLHHAKASFLHVGVFKALCAWLYQRVIFANDEVRQRMLLGMVLYKRRYDDELLHWNENNSTNYGSPTVPFKMYDHPFYPEPKGAVLPSDFGDCAMPMPRGLLLPPASAAAGQDGDSVHERPKNNCTTGQANDCRKVSAGSRARKASWKQQQHERDRAQAASSIVIALLQRLGAKSMRMLDRLAVAEVALPLLSWVELDHLPKLPVSSKDRLLAKCGDAKQVGLLPAEKYTSLLCAVEHVFRLKDASKTIRGPKMDDQSAIAGAFRAGFLALLGKFHSANQIAGCLDTLSLHWCVSKKDKQDVLGAGFEEILRRVEAEDEEKREHLAPGELRRMLQLLGNSQRQLPQRNELFERLVAAHLAGAGEAGRDANQDENTACLIESCFRTPRELVDFACAAKECLAVNSFPLVLVFLRNRRDVLSRMTAPQGVRLLDAMAHMGVHNAGLSERILAGVFLPLLDAEKGREAAAAGTELREENENKDDPIDPYLCQAGGAGAAERRFSLSSKQASLVARAITGLDLLADESPAFTTTQLLSPTEEVSQAAEKRHKFRELASYLVRKSTLGGLDFSERPAEATTLAEAVADFPPRLREGAREFLEQQKAVCADMQGGCSVPIGLKGKLGIEASSGKDVTAEFLLGDGIKIAECGELAPGPDSGTATSRASLLNCGIASNGNTGEFGAVVDSDGRDRAQHALLALPAAAHALDALQTTARQKKTRAKVGRTVFNFQRILTSLPIADVLRLGTPGTTEDADALLLAQESAGFKMLHRDNNQDSIYDVEYYHEALNIAVMFVHTNDFVERQSGGLALFLPQRLRLRYWLREVGQVILVRRDDAAAAAAVLAETERSAGAGVEEREPGYSASRTDAFATDANEKSYPVVHPGDVRWSDDWARTRLQRGILAARMSSEENQKEKACPSLSAQVAQELRFQLEQLGVACADTEEARSAIELDI